MAKKWVADCSKYPSESHCDLVISGSDKEVVAEVAYQHAVGLHKHVADEAGLRDGIKNMLEEKDA
ncbi:MAG: DUF1059 domain-containing protein [bacterium]|nr:DUF1059 domain-containing protein [bacterium]